MDCASLATSIPRAICYGSARPCDKPRHDRRAAATLGPALIAAAGERAGMRFLEFFAANIRTRAGPMPARRTNSWPLVGIPRRTGRVAGCLTAKRLFGQGCRMRGFGSHGIREPIDPVPTNRPWPAPTAIDGIRPENQVRTGLPAGGRRIRTLGPSYQIFRKKGDGGRWRLQEGFGSS
jgi:hypothetical protein